MQQDEDSIFLQETSRKTLLQDLEGQGQQPPLKEGSPEPKAPTPPSDSDDEVEVEVVTPCPSDEQIEAATVVVTTLRKEKSPELCLEMGKAVGESAISAEKKTRLFKQKASVSIWSLCDEGGISEAEASALCELLFSTNLNCDPTKSLELMLTASKLRQPELVVYLLQKLREGAEKFSKSSSSIAPSPVPSLGSASSFSSSKQNVRARSLEQVAANLKAARPESTVASSAVRRPELAVAFASAAASSAAQPPVAFSGPLVTPRVFASQRPTDENKHTTETQAKTSRHEPGSAAAAASAEKVVDVQAVRSIAAGRYVRMCRWWCTAVQKKATPKGEVTVLTVTSSHQDPASLELAVWRSENAWPEPPFCYSTIGKVKVYARVASITYWGDAVELHTE